jgi:hypothetical protein
MDAKTSSVGGPTPTHFMGTTALKFSPEPAPLGSR